MAEGLKNEEILKAMGISLEEAQRVDQELVEKTRARKRDSRICICGHAVNKHNVYAGILECKPSAMICPCKKIRPILETSDTRMFLRKTEGAGVMHALNRGIVAAITAGKEVHWLENLACDKCKGTDGQIVPAPVTSNGVPMNHPTGFDVLMCYTCRTSA